MTIVLYNNILLFLYFVFLSFFFGIGSRGREPYEYYYLSLGSLKNTFHQLGVGGLFFHSPTLTIPVNTLLLMLKFKLVPTLFDRQVAGCESLNTTLS